MDVNVAARLQLEIIVRDEAGTELDVQKFSEIAFDFDTELIEGEFYEAPHLGIFYYLESADGDRLHWIVLETFQHGMLMQARIVQQRQHAKGYVRVEDERIRRRLTRRLAALNESSKAAK